MKTQLSRMKQLVELARGRIPGQLIIQLTDICNARCRCLPVDRSGGGGAMLERKQLSAVGAQGQTMQLLVDETWYPSDEHRMERSEIYGFCEMVVHPGGKTGFGIHFPGVASSSFYKYIYK